MLTVSSWIQPVLLTLVVASITWAVLNAQSVTKQQQTITSLQAQTSAEQQRFLTEKQKMQAQLAQQQATLNELTQKQTLLQNLVDALPSSLSESTLAPEQQNDSGNELDNDSIQATDEQPIQGDFQSQSQQLEQSQHQLLSSLSESIELRSLKLSASLAEVGIAPSKDSGLAQGGPYHQLELEQLPEDFLSTIDSLVALNNLEQVLTTLPDSMPVAQDNYYISSQFGFRKDPITGKRAYHKGVDLAGWHKTEITAPAAGTVLRAGRNGGYGKFIEIQHAHGLVSRFGHLHTIKVKKGQQIDKSDVIALMGSTGRSTSTHLHYEVLQNGKHINPVKLTKVINRVQ